MVETSLCVGYVGGQTECNEVAAQMAGCTPDGSCGTHPWPSGRVTVTMGFKRSTMGRLPKNVRFNYVPDLLILDINKNRKKSDVYDRFAQRRVSQSQPQAVQ